MDPADEVSGVQARLNNLGFDCGEPDGVLDDDTKSAVRAFQVLFGLEPSGEIDDAFREKLLACYDPAQDEASQQVEPEEEEAEEDAEETG
jgi:N-acetylmuramoyl-L-alanine amidase